jgi:HK97 family phage portal protein
MNLLQRFVNGFKGIKNQSYSTSDSRILELLGGNSSAAGYAVTEDTAMRVSAVYACVRLIAGAVATMPLNVYERTKEGRKELDSPLWYLLNESPSSRWTSASMWEWVIKCNCLNGDAFVVIKRNAAGVVTELRPLHPHMVRVHRVGDRLTYSVNEYGNYYGVDQDDMLHIAGFGFDGEHSHSVIEHSAFQSIGIALATDEYSGKFFANGAMTKHLISSDKKVSSDQADELRRIYSNKYAGPSNAGLPMVLSEGLKLTELSMTSADAELLESRKYQVIDIARAFGVPPHMIGAQDTTSSWGSGVEQMSIGFVKYTLNPYLNRITDEVNRKIFRTARYYIEFNVDGLLRGDSKAESDALRQAVGGSQGIGWMTPNEVRKLKNLPPIEGGDVLYDPKNIGAKEPLIDDETDTA